MRKKAQTHKKIVVTRKHDHWLPVDERLIPDIFAFRKVKGLARIFLEVEMALATLVVLGTLFLTLLHAFGL